METVMKTTIALMLLLFAFADLAAASQQSAEASRKLGMRYYRGEGVPLDYDKAVHHLGRAVAQGDSEAANILGKMYEFGMGVKEDEALSAKWYIAGAELNDPFSQFHASIALYKGAGVPRDRAQAVKWWTLALGHGEKQRKRWGPTIEHVEANLAPEELAEGRRLAAQWRPSTRSVH
jgi:TPR repeat protein